jgi:hypothetical protein
VTCRVAITTSHGRAMSQRRRFLGALGVHLGVVPRAEPSHDREPGKTWGPQLAAVAVGNAWSRL